MAIVSIKMEQLQGYNMKNTLGDIVNMISLRTFLRSSMDGLNVAIARAQIKEVQAKITELDKVIIAESLRLDFSTYYTNDPKTTISKIVSIEASESTEDTMRKVKLAETK